MYLTSITHRRELFDLATRWFADCPHRGDGRFLTQVTTYENLISAPVVRDLLTNIKQAVHPGPVSLARLRSKDELRDAIVRACKDSTPREAELFSHYHAHPEDYFPGTPSDVILGLREDGSILGMARIKRLRRIAEKCSRRVADRLAGAIAERARSLAQHRAAARGIPLAALLSTAEEMAQDYHEAEAIVSRTFRDGILVFKPEDLRIDDGIGLKFVGTHEELKAMEETIRNHPSVVYLEREEHRGKYNDTNLLLDLALPEPGALVDLARDWDWSRHAGKGLSPFELRAGFPAFVEGGERTFRAEVILTTHADLVESEFGSCIHEARILEQRNGITYSGRIASNASFLIEYMLMLALSPTLEVGDLPVKMWGRYLPDVYSLSVWKLFGITLGRDQIDHLVPWGAEARPLALETEP
jgi:hypothetical protein